MSAADEPRNCSLLPSRLVQHSFKRLRLLRQRYAASLLARRRRPLASCNTLASQASRAPALGIPRGLAACKTLASKKLAEAKVLL